MSVDADAYAAFQKHGGIADLSKRTKLRFTGEDRARYINGQVSANISTLKAGCAVPACVTTAKGKLEADVVVSATIDELLVDAAAVLRDTLPIRFERYIIADDVLVEDVTNQCTLLHFLKKDPATIRDWPGPVYRTNRFGEIGWDVWIPAHETDSVSREFAEFLISPELLEVIRIERGVPQWGAELSPDTLPPEAGLDRTHIDYHKGCYIGQEVISRIRSVGHVNRTLASFVSDRELLQAGMSICNDAQGGKVLGTITSAAWSFALAKPIGLGYLKRGSSTEGFVARLLNTDQPSIPVTVSDPLHVTS